MPFCCGHIIHILSDPFCGKFR